MTGAGDDGAAGDDVGAGDDVAAGTAGDDARTMHVLSPSGREFGREFPRSLAMSRH